MADDLLKVVIQNEDAIKELVTLIPEAANRALNDYIRTIKTKVMDRTPVGQVYQKGKRSEKTGQRVKGSRGKSKYVTSGHLWGSWKVENPSFDKIAIFTDIPYANILEKGSYRGVGPRTISASGGIFSKQAVGGILKPLLEGKELIDGMVNRVVKEITSSLS